MKIQSISLVLLTFLLKGVFAQAPGGNLSTSAGGLDFLAAEDELPASFSNKSVASAESYIASRGWVIGRNDGGRYVAIGIGDIIGDPASPAFQTKRRNAFTKAMLDAKSEIVKYYETSIARAVAYSYGEGDIETLKRGGAPGLPEGDAELSILQKAKLLLHAELDEALGEKGVAEGSKEAEAVVQEVLSAQERSRLTDTISRLAKSEVGGLVVSKIFEDSGNVVVVATYSPTVKTLAAALNGKGVAPKVRVRQGVQTVGEWIIALGVGELYPAFGVQLTSDKYGNLVLLSYAQAVAKGSSKLSRQNAIERAESDADGYIRSFAGEVVAYSNLKQEVESNEIFTADIVETMAESISETSISSAAAGLNISGITTGKQWQTQDKRSNCLIVGVVRRWDIGSAMNALSDGSEMTVIGGGQGGSGVSAASGGAALQSNQNRESVNVANSGAAYNHESMKSEDF